jgi:hydroxyacylglutathione hydrolase
MNHFNVFTGGALETNAFFLESPAGSLLFDAPEGADDFFAGHKIDWLLLTHGHFDHVMDAAKIQRRHGCRVGFHPDTAEMVGDGSFFKNHGFDIQFDPVATDLLIEEGIVAKVGGFEMVALHVPGHCRGSLCFYFPELKSLVGGDVLFLEGVGRWDLPGGDGPLLFNGIRSKIFSLPEETIVFPGHGPSTTIGHERSSNPFVEE